MIRERANGHDSDVDDARASGDIDAEMAAIAGAIGADWQGLRLSLRRWATVEFQRLRLRIADSFFAVVLVSSAVLSLIAVTITASVFLIIGLRALFARWTFGGLPELIAAVCGLGLAFGVALALRAWVRKSIVRTAARRLAALGATSGVAPSSLSGSARTAGEPA